MEVKLYPRPSKGGKDVIYIEFKVNGKRTRKSTNLEYNKGNVAYVYRNIIPKIEEKIKYGLDVREYKLSEFTKAVLAKAKENKKSNTHMSYEQGLNKFFSLMGDIDVEKVNVRFIEEYIDKMKKQGLSSATINLYLVPLKLALKEAMRLEVISKNPVALAEKPTIRNKEKKAFNLINMHKLLDKSQGELKTFLYFAFFTGARPGEVVALRWSDIVKDRINIDRTAIQNREDNLPKSGKKRTIALLKPLKDYIKTVERKGDAIFSKTYATYAQHFSDFVVSLGMERTTLHTTRHTFASLLLKSREDPTLIQYFLGHSSINTLNKTYAHYIEDDRDTSRISDFLAQSLAQ